jgi:serine/threonine protein kinase
MNVLLGAAHEPYLADFGLARVLPAASSKLDPTKQPRIAGSYGYIAPGIPRIFATTWIGYSVDFVY